MKVIYYRVFRINILQTFIAINQSKLLEGDKIYRDMLKSPRGFGNHNIENLARLELRANSGWKN